MQKSLAILLIVIGSLFAFIPDSKAGPYKIIRSYEQIYRPIYLDRDHGWGGIPKGDRGQKFQPWLAPSIKITVTVNSGARKLKASGSGTICYYDQEKNLAYIISCGHLWTGNGMSVEECTKNNITCALDVFYHNETHLDTPKQYIGRVIFYSNMTGADYSLLTFTPDWKPIYCPIAPLDYTIPNDSHQHSCGCDAGSECANYDVQIVGVRRIGGMPGIHMVTRNNSPCPGRSGGGLMTDDGYYIGICWGTERRDGSGLGFFTPLVVIHDGYTKNGHSWLLSIPLMSDIARKIPIIDKFEPSEKYDKEYILMPSK